MIEEDELQNVRVSHFVAPVSVIIPGPEGWAQLLVHVPIDDEHTMFWHVRANVERPYTEDEERVHRQAAGLVRASASTRASTAPRRARTAGCRIATRCASATGSPGMHGTINEDHAVQESMGPISTARTSTSAPPTRP